MRRAAVLACLSLAACNRMTSEFHLSGQVDMDPSLADSAPKDNAVLFIVAANAGGVPVAIHRIVNPEFPAPFDMSSDDLIVPALRRDESLSVHAELNSRGDVGRPRPGDLEGRAPSPLRLGASGVLIVLDQRL